MDDPLLADGGVAQPNQEPPKHGVGHMFGAVSLPPGKARLRRQNDAQL